MLFFASVFDIAEVESSDQSLGAWEYSTCGMMCIRFVEFYWEKQPATVQFEQISNQIKLLKCSNFPYYFIRSLSLSASLPYRIDFCSPATNVISSRTIYAKHHII